MPLGYFYKIGIWLIMGRRETSPTDVVHENITIKSAVQLVALLVQVLTLSHTAFATEFPVKGYVDPVKRLW